MAISGIPCDAMGDRDVILAIGALDNNLSHDLSLTGVLSVHGVALRGWCLGAAPLEFSLGMFFLLAQNLTV